MRPKGPRAGMVFLGRRQSAPSPATSGFGDRCKVFLHSRGAGWPLLELVGATFGRGHVPLAPLPFKSDYDRLPVLCSLSIMSVKMTMMMMISTKLSDVSLVSLVA